ncbi:ANTAR domain-containing protein [Azohydromonas lata]|uniref:Response regulator n=1 Tax=Azohydromonas lata TaxID=45677 RepID=A0ABU5ICM8_9BURK|nr:hypothetical protein [Azohydromonas lata]MDZ5456884.1 hypothetical protein [Azohydromonas lata]
MTALMPTVLLFEPHFVLRRTVAAAARQLGIAEVHEAATLHAADRLAQLQRYDFVIVALDGAPVADIEAFAKRCNAGRVIGMQAPGLPVSCAGVSDTLHKPLKVKSLLSYLMA